VDKDNNIIAQIDENGISSIDFTIPNDISLSQLDTEVEAL